MNTRDLMTYGGILAVLVGALAAINFFFVQPMVKPDLQPVEAMAPIPVSPPRANTNIVATTMDKIKGMLAEKPFDAEYHPRKVERNPFLWPYELAALISGQGGSGSQTPDKMASASSASPKKLEPPPPPVVGMIIIGENRKLALLNDIFVMEGSRFEGKLVKRIEKSAVILSGKTGEERISISEFTFAVPSGETKSQADRPAGEPTRKEMLEDVKMLLREGT